MWIGIDDTDSSKGGCTTHVAIEVIRVLIENGYDIIGYPRLVRLNPNNPYKTRGNGAVAIRCGVGKGEAKLIGHVGDDVRSYCKGKDEGIDNRTKSKIIEVIEEYSSRGKNTNPGIVFTKNTPSPDIYHRAVHRIIELEEINGFMPINAEHYSLGSVNRGLIGAIAAISWRPRRVTYELIAYRMKENIGKKRQTDKRSAMVLDRKLKYTFNNYDITNDYVAISPHSPCPVLYGVRGLVPGELIKALDIVRGEPWSKWVIFRTNQSTDEHIRRSSIDKLSPYTSIRAEGKVLSKPSDLPGGHVVFDFGDETGKIKAIAYEPTKEFRDIIRCLHPEDEIVIYGSVREEPYGINLEKITIIKLATRMVKISNPVCPECGLNMKSVGKGMGYKCRKCGRKADECKAMYEKKPSDLVEGKTYDVPIIARRHLFMPTEVETMFKELGM